MEQSKAGNKYEPIGNYGVIGNLHTVALISLKGSIDFMCFPEFDSPTIFAGLLDSKKGGSFSITPQLDEMDYKQLYLPDTNILLTRFLSEEGVAEITDFMPVKENDSRCILIRRVTNIKGKLKFRMHIQPRFDYARGTHEITEQKNELIFQGTGEDAMCMRLLSSVPLATDGTDGFAEFTLDEKETADFILEAVSNQPTEKIELEHYVSTSFIETVNYWKRWIGQCTYQGRWREMVNRSALTLKLLTSYKYGSVVAAPTFGLPEKIKGVRNWDYRYTWIRDAAFTMYAFIRLGFIKEADAFMNWIKKELEEIADIGSLQLMYAIDGNLDLEEEELDHLEGYMGSKPVRIGNGAHKQMQLDIYGELMDCVYLYNKFGRPITYDFWQKMEAIIDFVMQHWQEEDHGIWEVRDEKKQFLSSRLMCWVAIDRAIKLAEERSFPSPLEAWREVRNTIFKDIYHNFWNEDKQAYVQHKNSTVLDASAFLIPLMRFLSNTEPRWVSTLEALEKELVSDTLVYRYKLENGASDGLHGDEGTFSMCTFWYVECLSKGGQVEKGRLFFEKMLGYANHLGLFAEQLGNKGEHLGNFPQAFTHLGLISAALELNDKLTREGWRA